MESQSQNPEFRNNPENFLACDFIRRQLIWIYTFQMMICNYETVINTRSWVKV